MEVLWLLPSITGHVTESLERAWQLFPFQCWRRCRLVFSTFASRSIGPGLSPDLVHCVVFLGKTLYSHSVSLSKNTRSNVVMD